MSYRITINGNPFCSSEFEHTAVIDPKVTLEVNKAGSLTFTMTPEHPYYNGIEFRQSLFDVYQNDELIFEGVPVSETTDFWNRKTVVCEGDLTFLNDTIQRQAVYQNQTVQSLLSSYLSVHNAQADASKQFTVGSVTVSGGNTIYRYTNYQSTMQELQEDLIENFGGYFRVRHSGGVRYLDYLDSSPHNSSQTIRIGKNLVDFSRNLSSLDICTVLIPLGAKTGNQVIDGLDERLDIKSVNSNLDYLVGTAQAYYGNIWKTQVWDDVTTAAALKSKGQDYLDDAQWANLVISATAFDLGLATEDVEQFHVLDMIKVVSEPHGIDRYFMLTKLEMDLDHPASTKITLGKDERLSLSAQTAKAEVQIERQPTNILVSASESARQILDSATDGAIQILYNSDGVAYELRINNSQDPDSATKWWRYNVGGWGFTADGGQTYTTAATNDGTIFATLIKAGILSSDNGKFYVNLDTGAATLSDVTLDGGSINLGPNVFTVDSAGNVVANSLTSSNAEITGGRINISTNNQDYDYIILNHSKSKTYVSSNTLAVENKSTATHPYMKSIMQGAGIFMSNTNTAKTLAELIVTSGYGYFALMNSSGTIKVSARGDTGNITADTVTANTFTGALSGNATSATNANYATSAGTAGTATNATNWTGSSNWTPTVSNGYSDGYIRFPNNGSKLQIAWKRVAWQGKINTIGWPNMYESAQISLGDWKAAFLMTPAVAYGVHSGHGYSAWICSGQNNATGSTTTTVTSTSAGTVYLERGSALDSNEIWYIMVVAIGPYS